MKHMIRLDEHETRLGRRQLIKGLTAASAATVLSRGTGAALTEGAGRVRTAASLTAKWVSHYTYIAPDLRETADWYEEVFGMQRGDANSREVHLWYGDTGGDTLMIVRQANAGESAPGLEKLAFIIEDWDQRAVEAELERRGLHPISDTDRGFWFTDLEGNEIGVFAEDFVSRPPGRVESPTLWKGVSTNHVQIMTSRHREMATWYKDVLGLTQVWESETEAYLDFADSVSIIAFPRVDDARSTSAALGRYDHAAYTIEDYDHEAVEAELTRRGLKPQGSYGLSHYFVDINSHKIQVCDLDLVPFALRQLRGGGG